MWSVTMSADGPWEIRHNGKLVETYRSHYDFLEVLAAAEAMAGGRLAWTLNDESTGMFSEPQA